MMKRFLIVWILTFACAIAQAQTAVKHETPLLTISGKAVDALTGGSVGFTTVRLLAAKDSALVAGQVADSAGAFRFTGIPAGQYVLLLLSMGYGQLYKPIVTGTTQLGALPLSPLPNQLGTVTVAGARPPFQRLADKLVLNIAGNQLFAASANVYDILRKVPGLELAGDGSILMSGRVTPAVFVDGRPMPMSPEALQHFLSSLTPGMIASIDIISNPSGQYDGEYKGIIDIRLKRDETLGWNGSLTTNLQRNDYTLADNSLHLSYKTKKIAYTARTTYTGGSNIRRYGAYQHLANTNVLTTRTQTVTGNNNPGLQLGADYSPRNNHRLGLQLGTYHSNLSRHAYNTLHTRDATETWLLSATNSDNRAEPKQHNYSAHLNYNAHLGKNRLDVLASLVKISNMQQEDIQNRELATEKLLTYWKTDMKNDILIRAAQADFQRDAGKGKFGAGAKFAFTTTQNDLRYDTLAHATEFVYDSSRSNQFLYNEYITAGYLTYSGSKNKWSYQASLRAEHTRSVANAVTIGEVTNRSYLTWLPAFNITYAIGTGHQVNFSYSHRLTRPVFGQLNPFRFYFSPLNYWVGNPNLKASTTKMLNAAYTHPAFNVTVQLGREKDPMTRYPEYDSATNILQYLGRNLPYNDFAAIELSFPLRVTKWWKMQHTARGNYKKEQTPYHDKTYAIPVTDVSISGSQLFSLPYAATLDISYYYRSPSGNGLYYIRPTGNLDVGLQKSWAKGKLNSRINFYDLFGTQRAKLVFREKQLINNQLEHWFGSRRLAVSLTWSFGRSTHKSRQGSKNEEEMRAGI